MILANHGIISSSGGLPPSTLLTNLYAVYKAESNANDSLGNYNGTAVGGLTYTTGISGNSFQLNGTNAKVVIPQSYFNFGSDSLSISLWFYPNLGNVLQGLLNKGLLSASEKGFNILIDNRYNSNPRGISFGVGGGSGNYQQLSTTTQYNVSSWNHVVCVWDAVAKTIKIYLNGVQATTTITQTGGTGLTNITDISIPTRVVNIGAIDITNWYNGNIDEMIVWNKVLTATEITELQTKFYPF